MSGIVVYKINVETLVFKYILFTIEIKCDVFTLLTILILENIFSQHLNYICC